MSRRARPGRAGTVVERLAAEVARLTGESTTEAIRRALDERKRRVKGSAPGDRRARVSAPHTDIVRA